MKTARPTVVLTTDLQIALLEEQASFHVAWHEPVSMQPWGEFIRRIFLLEAALDPFVTLNGIQSSWPDFDWGKKGKSTLRRWLKMEKSHLKKLPSQSKSYLRSLAHWHLTTRSGETK